MSPECQAQAKEEFSCPGGPWSLVVDGFQIAEAN